MRWSPASSGSTPYLVQCTHPSNGADVVGDGDQRGAGEVLLADGLSLFFTHHVAKAMLEISGRVFKVIPRQDPGFHQGTLGRSTNNPAQTHMT